MMYKIVYKLPKDCKCIDKYLYPFKFAKGRLYVYEPGVSLGDAVWYRRSYDINSRFAVQFFQIYYNYVVVRRYF